MKPFYDYNVKDAYSRLNSLISSVILFRDSFRQPYPYISGRLKDVKIIQISDTDSYAVNIELEPPLMEFKEKPTHDLICTIVQNYEKMSGEQREKIRKSDNAFVGAIVDLIMAGDEYKRISRWKFWERRKKEENLVLLYLNPPKESLNK